LNFENIQMAVVRRSDNGVKVNISEVNEDNRYDKYECIVCGSEVIPVAPDNKVVNGDSAKVTPHFKHAKDSKCGSESFIHFWTKTEFLKVGDKFKVITDVENEFVCNQIYFEEPIIVDGKKYIPDATIFTSCGNTIHFEFNYSNSKKIKDYLDKWEKLNQIIVEIDISTLLCVFDSTIPTFKALYYEGKCFNLNSEDSLYIRTVGEYNKISQSDRDSLNDRKSNIEKLDWLWDKIRQYKNDELTLEEIGKEIQSINTEDMRLTVVEIFSKTNCKNNVLKNYTSFMENKIQKRLKLLNLKYNGYLIKYTTKIPNKIYDRIFKGVIIEFHVLNSDTTEIYQTNRYDFKEEILSHNLKTRIDNSVQYLSNTNNLIIKIKNAFNLDNKVKNMKFHFRESTDYMDALYIKDYRDKTFVFHRENIKDLFIDFINSETHYIDLRGYYWNNYYIIETNDSYKISSNDEPLYEFNKIFNQKIINITCKFFNNSFIYLPHYDLKEVVEKLNIILEKIKKLKLENKYDENKVNGEIISDFKINNEIKEILFPLVKVSNNLDMETLNLIFNKNDMWELREFSGLLGTITGTKINYRI
jgi:hypothetical protein